MTELVYQNIIVSRDGPVGIIQLNRPDVLNALNDSLMNELVEASEALDKDDHVLVIILTGGEKVFAAGIDLKEMAQSRHIDLTLSRRFEIWDRLRKIGKPIIAAVSGYCLGGGNELAMNCDIIIASETAVFGQPEVNVGIMPGAGGTQKLTKIVGKFKAMEMILTGDSIPASEAYRIGLVNRISTVKDLMNEAKKMAFTIASKPPISVRAAKEAILKAEDTTMQIGLEFERKMFYTLFSTDDGKEGMRAFIEKRKPAFKGR
ncbi:MAG TPA: enoyl-CoA hydratase-related protein [Candidatus Saccharimonadales bacterium]|nr:enoyl-CoA hydratase-related protein [Candidatus Saccharimonadales bacterium]